MSIFLKSARTGQFQNRFCPIIDLSEWRCVWGVFSLKGKSSNSLFKNLESYLIYILLLWVMQKKEICWCKKIWATYSENIQFIIVDTINCILCLEKIYNLQKQVHMNLHKYWSAVKQLPAYLFVFWGFFYFVFLFIMLFIMLFIYFIFCCLKVICKQWKINLLQESKIKMLLAKSRTVFNISYLSLSRIY